MGDKSKIQWTDATWNPVSGCTKASPGCQNCYAERMSKRLAGRAGYPEDEPFRVTLHPDKLDQPLRWKKPRFIFVVSMGDLFHEDVSNEYIAAVFGVMAAAKHHTFQVLTKRPERALEWFRWIMNQSSLPEVRIGREAIFYGVPPMKYFGSEPDWSWPLQNVWLGTTVEAQHLAARRIPALIQCPAAVRFVSCEPLLEHVSLETWLGVGASTSAPPYYADRPRLDWVICGGESGANARPMHIDWARSLRDQCVKHDIPFWIKQWGEWITFGKGDPRPEEFMSLPNEARGLAGGALTIKVGKRKAGSTLDGKTWEQMPEPWEPDL